jgi:hypothetical protein
MLKICCVRSPETHVRYTVFCVAYTVSRFAPTDFLFMSLFKFRCNYTYKSYQHSSYSCFEDFGGVAVIVVIVIVIVIVTVDLDLD